MSLKNCECLFCGLSSSDVYEINGNSILIENEVVDIDNILFELFLRRTDSQQTNFICEACKDLLVQFYFFKQNAKNVLRENPAAEIFDVLTNFTNTNNDKEFVFSITENEFFVTFKPTHELVIEVKKEPELSLNNEEHLSLSAIEEEIIDEVVYEDAQYEEIENESEKMEVDESESEVTCKCGLQFENVKDLLQHRATTKCFKRRQNSSTHDSLKCDQSYCKIKVKDSKFMKMHMKAHESFEAILPLLPTYDCTECKTFYCDDRDLQLHQDMHKNETLTAENLLIKRPSLFEDNFETKENKNKEDDETFVQCGHCGIKNSIFAIRIHLLFMHTSSIYCPIDHRCFEGKKQLRVFVEHVKNKHAEIFGDQIEYTCTYCEDKFPSTFERLAHMKMCNEKKFICKSHCGKRFKSEWHLNQHIKFVELGDDRFTCNLCSKCCISRSDLQIHMRSHTDERPYQCTICEKAFKTSANRSSHMDIHREDKIHECNICLEKFQTRPILRKHKKKHDKEYQIKCMCKICGKNYINRNHLLRHIKTSHGQPDLTGDQIENFFKKEIGYDESLDY